ncbi:MAG: isocitrate lyase/PEP mutase family protein [Candidatus Tyrphobacter sp.]
MPQRDAYERFRSLHEGSQAFVMPNAWDGASAALLAREGFQALGSTSYAIALALGRQDGRHMVSRDVAVANAALLAQVSGLPVNGDLEDGFGPSEEDCADTVRAAIDAGLAGVGIEDTTANPAHPIHDFDRAVARVAAAARAAHGKILLTGRTDNFLHGIEDLDDTIARLCAFAQAGADVLYAPALPSLDAVRAVCRAVAPKPVNVLVGLGGLRATLQEFSEAGVRRLSLGAALYRVGMNALVHAARALRAGELNVAMRAVPGGEIASLLPQQ